MIYDDFQTLSDNEYLKLAEQYNLNNILTHSEVVSVLFQSVTSLLNHLLLINFPQNINIKNELIHHKQVLTKLKNNLSLLFKTEDIQPMQYNNFNLFNYLSNLTNIQNILNDWLKIDNKSKYINFILNTKYEINNLIISLSNILSKLNIKIFNYM